jgi:anti-anti-sigma regulatory factor
MPSIVLPSIQMENVAEIATASFSIALVIMAETLLAENNFAKKNRYEINDNQEILAFSLGNFASAIFGCCPVNGSVSRTTLGEQYGAKTQLTSVVAGVSMVLILLFGTGFISYLPVPVLTAIVISALLSATEFDLLLQLRKISRLEFFIFLGAFFGVLLLGTINGVLVGIVLSFMAVVKEAAAPPRSFLGLVPGHGEFLELSRFKHAYPIQGVILYRFSSNLFFANVSLFQKDILGSIKEDTRAVIVDASAIGNIDVTAAKSLEILYESLKERGIKLYITEHMAQLNVQLRKLGLGYMIEAGTIRQTMERALADCQIYRPYPLEGVHNSYHDIRRRKAEDAAQELVWAFGEEAEEIIEKHVMDAIGNMKNEEDVDAVLNGFWNQMPLEDQDEWLEHLEAHIQEIVRATGEGEEKLAELIEQRRHQIMTLIEKEHPELAERYREHRASVERQLKENNPKAFEIIRKIRENNNL